jgi:hypothetical protein
MIHDSIDRPLTVLGILIALGFIWTAVWAAVLSRPPLAMPPALSEKSDNRVRLILLASFSAICMVLFILTPLEHDLLIWEDLHDQALSRDTHGRGCGLRVRRASAGTGNHEG